MLNNDIQWQFFIPELARRYPRVAHDDLFTSTDLHKERLHQINFVLTFSETAMQLQI